MKKILIISLFLFGQQAFSEVIPSDQLTGIYKNQGKTNTYKINEVESRLNFVNSILCYFIIGVCQGEHVYERLYDCVLSCIYCRTSYVISL